MNIAITREVSSSIGQCELTHLAREPIDLETARRQHADYEALLTSLGWTLTRLPAADDLPDSVFVEDAAVVLDEVAVVMRPGAESRRPERDAVAEALRPYRDLRHIQGSGTIDGGDVLLIDRTLYVGVSSRTSRDGAAELTRLVEPFGYQVETVDFEGCLHLKTAVTVVAPDTILINPDWVDASRFTGMSPIVIDPEEPFAANALLLDGVVIYPSAFERTRSRLERNGIDVRTVEASELAKAEGGVTCCSLLVRAVGS